MPSVLMTLGSARFSVQALAYEQLTQQHAWRWSEQARLGREAALQYLGSEASSLELTGVCYPAWRGKASDLQRLREMADAGKPYMLTDGTGRVWGPWTIAGLRQQHSALLDDGCARRIEFVLQLKSYGEDRMPWWLSPPQQPQDAGAQALPSAQQLLQQVRATPVLQPGMDSASLQRAAERSVQLLQSIHRLLQQLGQPPQGASSQLRQAMQELARWQPQALAALLRQPQALAAELRQQLQQLLALLQLVWPWVQEDVQLRTQLDWLQSAARQLHDRWEDLHP